MLDAARPTIDLTRYAFVRELGDIRLYGTWIYDADLDDDEPALVIVPAYRTIQNGIKPCVVALSAAFRYTDPKHLARTSLVFAKALGFEDTLLSSANKIGNIIHDHLLDLIKLPENPTDTLVGASARVDFGDGRTRTVEILDHVPTPQA